MIVGAREVRAEEVLGLDIGGTKTRVMRASARDDDPAWTADMTVPTAQWRAQPGDPASDALGLHRLLAERFGDAVLRAPLAAGAHGCDSTQQCRDLEEALRARGFERVLVVNDSELMAPALGTADAVGVVVGTGSIATARTAAGELLTAGGWGWLLGDEGSAPGLVRDAVREVLTGFDHGEQPDALGVRMLACFGARDGAELASAATRMASADAWGQHAPEVFAAAEEGSLAADCVIGDAGRALAGLVDSLLVRGIRADTVVAGGSVIERQPRLQLAVRDALARTRPELALAILDRPPVRGAISIARALADTSTPTSLRTEI